MEYFEPVLPEKFSAKDIKNVCRICLFPNSMLYSIFENQIDVLLSPFTANQVDPNDGYPHQICHKCYQDVRTAYYFRKQFEHAQNLVKSVLKAPTPKKNIICNLCSTTFCSNSNLKRHLKNIHGLVWEIGMPRPDEPHNSNTKVKRSNRDDLQSACFDKWGNFKLRCEFCDQHFELEVDYKMHFCTNIDQDEKLYTDPYGNSEEPDFENSSSNSQKTDYFGDNVTSNLNIAIRKGPSLKELVFRDCDMDEEKIQIFNYLNLIPEQKQLDYKKLLERKTNERHRAYKILKRIHNLCGSIKKRQCDKYECTECKMVFNQISVFRRHQFVHSNELRPFSCGICFQTFSGRDSLIYHINIWHSKTEIEEPFQCTFCRTSYSRILELMSHINVCGLENQGDSSPLLMHTESEQICVEHDVIIDEDSKLTDTIYEESNLYRNNRFCGDSFDNDERNYFDHKNYNNETCYDLTNYDDSMLSDESYNRQEYVEANRMLDAAKSKEYILNLLSGYPSTAKLIGKKMEAMERNKNGKFDCEICDKEFNRKAHLQRHYLTHTNSKPFCCEFCNSKFSCPEYVQSHMNRVHADKIEEIVPNPTIDMKFCNYKIVKPNESATLPKLSDPDPNPNWIVKHRVEEKRKKISKYEMLKTDDGKFKCRFCPKLYNRAEHVRRHEQTHSDLPKPFKCTFCNKEFSRSDNMKKHVQTCVKKISNSECN